MARHRKRLAAAIGAGAAALLAGPVAAAQAAVFNVNTTANDQTLACEGGGPCSLRGAIFAANHAPGSTVYVPAGTYRSDGLPISADGTVVVGDGSGATILDANGGPGLRVESADDVALFNLTLKNGRGTDRQGTRGGNLYFMSRTPSGTLLLSGLEIMQGNATYGGGVFAGAGHLTMVDSRVWNNGATQGGGVYIGGYSAVFDGVAIDSNGASEGGGGVWTAVSTSVRNSTFYGNGSPYFGGAITASGAADVDITHVTMGRNHSAGAAELALLGDSTVNLTNSIIGMPGTAGAADGVPNGGGTACRFSSGTLVDDHSTAFDSSCHLTAARGSIENADPQFLGFGDYGGPTPSLAFASTSPAVDAANSDPTVCPTIDQRYAPRPMGTGCDIGALESPFTRAASGSGGPAGGGGGGTAGGGGGGGIGGGGGSAAASADTAAPAQQPVAPPPVATPVAPVTSPPAASDVSGSLARPRLARDGRLIATTTLPATPRGVVSVRWSVRKGGRVHHGSFTLRPKGTKLVIDRSLPRALNGGRLIRLTATFRSANGKKQTITL